MITGSRYADTATLTTTEIARRIRADLKTAQTDGTLDATLKFSVKTEYFAGGSAVNATIKGYTGTLLGPDQHGRERWTPQARELAGTVRKIVDAYNYDGSDTRADYSNKRFHSHVEYAQLPGTTVA